jgi:class 3 adenylate cyclase
MLLPQAKKPRLGHPVAATVLIVDIRNFGSNLSYRGDFGPGAARFPLFLAHVYERCVRACLTACSTTHSNQFYLNSTGDGALCVFLSADRHFAHAYLAALILTNQLNRLCAKYNQRKPGTIPDVSFGIGIDSGWVRRIASTRSNSFPALEAYIGNCINTAARIESVTKDYERTSVLISERTNGLLCRSRFGLDYSVFMREAIASSSPAKRKRLRSQMSSRNEYFLMRSMPAHNLPDLKEPLVLFRLSPSLANPARAGFRRLLSFLCNNRAQRDAVIAEARDQL